MRADFDSFVKTLHDQGQGNVIAYDNIPWQSYVTKNLTTDQADMIKINPIVDIVGQITEEDGEAGIAASRKPRVQKRETSPRTGSDYHPGMLSAPPALMDTLSWPDYEFDTRLGQGQTIYIIDTGYRATHEVTASESGHMKSRSQPFSGVRGDRSDCRRVRGSQCFHSFGLAFRHQSRHTVS
jgi:subtilisin family serine protease